MKPPTKGQYMPETYRDVRRQANLTPSSPEPYRPVPPLHRPTSPRPALSRV
jgi:hypothetical protein